MLVVLYVDLLYFSMSLHIPIEFVETVRMYIVMKTLMLFVEMNEENKKCVMDYEIWDKIFHTLRFQIIYYFTISDEKESKVDEYVIYKKETFDDFITRHGDIKKLGPYDYTEFYKNMKDPEFYKKIKTMYEKCEIIKKIKEKIIRDVLRLYENKTNSNDIIVEYINIIPFYEYISKNNITLDEEPQYKHFRNNKSSFCELYTLWSIKQIT